MGDYDFWPINDLTNTVKLSQLGKITLFLSPKLCITIQFSPHEINMLNRHSRTCCRSETISCERSTTQESSGRLATVLSCLYRGLVSSCVSCGILVTSRLMSHLTRCCKPLFSGVARSFSSQSKVSQRVSRDQYLVGRGK